MHSIRINVVFSQDGWVGFSYVVHRYYSNMTAVLFALVLGTTLGFLFNRRQLINDALYKEVNVLNTMNEEIILASNLYRRKIRYNQDPQVFPSTVKIP